MSLAGLNVESPCMQRTFDLTTIKEAIGQQGEGVRADVVGGVEFASHAVDRNVLAADLYS